MQAIYELPGTKRKQVHMSGNNPTPSPSESDKHRNAALKALAAEHGPGYAVIIAQAGGLRSYLNETGETFDPFDIEQVTMRLRHLSELRGMQAAATALLHQYGQPHPGAEETVDMHTITMAVAVEQDIAERGTRN